MQVHDGKDKYATRLDTEQHTVGKTVNETPTDLDLNLGPHGRIVHGVLDGGVSREKSIPRPGSQAS